MREHVVNLALKLVGCPYVWGGGNPWSGLDCSGFVVWIYQVFGLLPSGDWTAQGLSDYFVERAHDSPAEAQPGDLVFYGRPGRGVTHVMIALGGGLCVGASGGGRKTTTIEEARHVGAQVKVKGVRYREDYFGWLHIRVPPE